MDSHSIEGPDLDQFKQRLDLYRQFDNARQQETERLAEEYHSTRKELENLKADLYDEKNLRQHYRKQYTDIYNSLNRNQFVLVLVDGDGYVFKNTYLRDVQGGGGARAAHDLSTQVLNYLQENNLVDPSNTGLEVMVNVYANRAGLAKYLCEANMIQMPAHLDQFFHSFTSRPLFQFNDCGQGKERADAKLRDTFKFFAYNTQCKYIFLACCHDNGYVAELDKYRHDIVAAPKTILVDSFQMGRDYKSLAFPVSRLSVFETQPLSIVKKEVVTVPPPLIPAVEDNSLAAVTDAISTNTQTSWSAAIKKAANSTSSVATNESPKLTSSAPEIVRARGIAVNRYDQRIDLKMQQPSNQDLADFEERLATKGKLCNRYHLANDCYNHNCHFNHDPIDARMMNTLRYKARTTPCQHGPACRDIDCFYGHQCPWGRDKCLNKYCAFQSKQMHNVTDVEVARYISVDMS